MSADRSFITEFVSDTCALVGYDQSTNTLHIALNHEHGPLYVHGFSLRARFVRVVGNVTISIDNAGSSQYAKAWTNHVPYVAQEGVWAPNALGSTYDGRCFTFPTQSTTDVLEVAWYEPYTLERLTAFVDDQLAGHDNVTIDKTTSGQTIISAGNANSPTLLVIGRQHPGEGIGSFVLEGMLQRLFLGDAVSQALLGEFCFLVVPAVNIEGITKGLHRHDTNGRDYNRSWTTHPPPSGLAPIKALLDNIGDLFAFIDVHGDEVSKVSFVNFRISKNISTTRRVRYETLLRLISHSKPKLLVLPSIPFPKRFVKALLRQRTFISPRATTANAYAANHHPTLSLTFEPSVHALTPDEARSIGTAFIEQLYASKSKEGKIR